MTANKRTVDRRIQRTERHLHEALSAQIQEKPFTSISYHGRLEHVVTELVAGELMRDGGRWNSSLPPDRLARHVAAAFVLVLNWWVESGSARSAVEINECFLALVSPLRPVRNA